MTSQLTLEAKLKAIIGTQVRGGCDSFKSEMEGLQVATSEKPCGNPYCNENKTKERRDCFMVGRYKIRGGHLLEYEDRIDILIILLDTHGAKAAYGEEIEEEELQRMEKVKDAEPWYPSELTLVITVAKWRGVSDKILRAWHSGSGNNYEAAIDTAYSFLPDA